MYVDLLIGFDFDTLSQYRDIAPESVSDERLVDLMKNFGKDDAGIKKAIEAMWNGM